MNEIRKLLGSQPDISGRRLYIWGAGNTAMLYREGLARIPDLKIEAFIDNDPLKRGKTILGAPVIPAEELVTGPETLVLICTGQPGVFTSLKEMLDRSGIDNAGIDGVIFKAFQNDVIKVYESLSDDESKRVYLEMLKNRVECRFPKEDIISRDQYFALSAFRAADPQETFIDCGAFVGDSVEKYIWENDGIFKRIIAFEPDSSNMRAMQYRVERLVREWNIPEQAITLLPYAVGDTDSTAFIERLEANNGLGSKLSSNAGSGDECRTVTLGKYITNDKCFIKADVESYEYKLLTGAREEIAKYRPKLAICIYHNAVDFFSIPLLLKELVPEYKLIVRHHLRTLAETVLYAGVTSVTLDQIRGA